jgi:Tfp pilus assembly protein PilO
MKLLFPIVAIIVAGGLFIGFINPQYKHIQTLRADEARYNRALDEASQLAAIRDKLQETRKNIPQGDLDNLEKLLPDQIDNIRFVMNLDNMATKYGLRISNVSVLPGDSGTDLIAAGNPYGSIGITFSVASNYTTFLKFLADLESSLRLVDITGLTFSSSQGGDLYGYQISLKTYWLK